MNNSIRLILIISCLIGKGIKETTIEYELLGALIINKE